jgi:uncharacterized paraquat-inducible protein A
MRIEKEIKLNEWLLGSTILCHSCGCLWLVPTPQIGETYKCRQCGAAVTVKSRMDNNKEDIKDKSNF